MHVPGDIETIRWQPHQLYVGGREWRYHGHLLLDTLYILRTGTVSYWTLFRHLPVYDCVGEGDIEFLQYVEGGVEKCWSCQTKIINTGGQHFSVTKHVNSIHWPIFLSTTFPDFDVPGSCKSAIKLASFITLIEHSVMCYHLTLKCSW